MAQTCVFTLFMFYKLQLDVIPIWRTKYQLNKIADCLKLFINHLRFRHRFLIDLEREDETIWMQIDRQNK